MPRFLRAQLVRPIELESRYEGTFEGYLALYLYSKEYKNRTGDTHNSIFNIST